MIHPVCLSGGVGSRLWPVSRALYPKQYLPLVDEQQTMLQQTLTRLRSVETGCTLIVCNDEHRFLVAEQLREMGVEDALIVLEPEGKNTAPAVALAAFELQKQYPKAVMLVLPADHVIKDEVTLANAIQEGEALAEAGSLVTFGIVPSAAETGFGYIKGGASVGGDARSIEAFVEKPDKTTAEQYLASGEYFWNSGMFMLRADVYLNELQKNAPDIYRAVEAAFKGASSDLDFLRVDAEAFAACPDDSIDYAVMEKTEKGVVLPLDAGWSDVGAWSALWEVQSQDGEGNVCRGDVISHDVSNSYLHSDSRLVAAVGLQDVVVVETADAVLVADKNSVQGVKQIVNQLKAAKRDEVSTHKQVFRPWGSYESLVSADGFQVKRIIVTPGQKLSLQKHFHRAEHWVVVKGSAIVQCGDEEMLLSEDQSTYIPLGNIHRLTNPGVIPLEIIEVQTGAYLGEDDIVRYEDTYGRSN